MKIIVITGPSGSGKSFLTKKLCNLFDDTIVIKTDSYYSDSLIIKLISILIKKNLRLQMQEEEKDLKEKFQSLEKMLGVAQFQTHFVFHIKK